MGIHVALHHATRYRYDRPVRLGPQTVRLRPAPHCRTPILAYALTIEPAGYFQNWLQDPHGNHLARHVFPDPVTEFGVVVDLTADLAVIDPFDFFLEPEAERWPFTYDPQMAHEIAAFRRTEPPGPRFTAWLQTVDRRPTQTVDFLVGLNQRLQREFGYVIRPEPGVQTLEETLALGRGSCRDTAWLLVQICRHLGFAARFASGYLIQLVADERPLDGPAGPDRDFTDLHAWAEIYLPGAGWIGFDPTSGLLAGEGHIPLACAPDPFGAAPVSGMVDPSEVAFGHRMSVTRISERPRIAKPYDDAAWERVQALGRRIDRDLAAGDVRLTMGGEPTFVSLDDRDGAEWTVAALGPGKRRLAGRLLRRLAARMAPGAVLHYGQGKWYPGEPLPRWALGCYWRRDGEPVWRQPDLLASDDDPADADIDGAEAFVTHLAERLGVDPTFVIPAHEDAWYYLWRERRLPVNASLGDTTIEGGGFADPLERERLSRVLEREGLDRPTGYVLPLARQGSLGSQGGAGHGRRARWRSGPWPLRAAELFLTPGDSPMGLRLPLDSLPWEPEDDRQRVVPVDPMSAHRPLPSHQSFLSAARPPHPAETRHAAPGRDGPTARQEQIAGRATVRTALCVEPRNGLLHVFLPPLEAAADWLALVAAIEETAAALGRRVVLEGYTPPHDPGLQHFDVTPDPGVIEVNIHPAASWEALVETTTTVYEEARQTRLSTEKFLPDGRHVGTGGGNHIVIGGPSAADSPLLRRPDLLRSLISYWHNHPALSYLFSGLFIGPTSQHPRVDEARQDSLHELETAFALLDRAAEDAGTAAPWLVDRVLRHLLVDVTGNTHRAEFCIDKLFSPDSAEGRRGLLELRAFEMPPHARMSLVQALLLRGLIAMFWQRPYRQRLVRWGNRLTDEFTLPHFVRQDFVTIIEDLKSFGYPFEMEWFEAHLQFRFPIIGQVVRGGVELVLHQALEPWHVLGEQAGAGGTARYVDSSVERVQLLTRGLVEGRHLVACNGHAVPLRPNGVEGEAVAGIRFRAWDLPNALHPTVPVQAPLVFDVFDRWNGRSLGGCTYHVQHPGGRNTDRPPVNGNEAEARRRARFFAIGHTPGPMSALREWPSLEMGRTLDLRRAAAGAG